MLLPHVPRLLFLAIALAITGATPTASVCVADDLQPALRRPRGLVLSADEQTLYAANRRSGTLSVIDLAGKAVVGEVAIGKQLSDLQVIGAGNRQVAIDEAAHELLLLTAEQHKVRVNQRVAVSPYPVSAVVTRDGKRCVVASLWSRRLTFVEFPDSDMELARVASSLDMPFAPRCQLLVKDDSRLLVADSFGGQLAVVDMETPKLLHVRQFPGHNIRGMATNADGSMLVVAHQMLNELAHTVRNDVHWGLLMSNDLRWLKLNAVLDPDSDMYDGAHMHPLGQAGSATGDPAGLVMSSKGNVVVSLGGVGEIAIGREQDFSLNRVRVGGRPTAVAVDSKGEFAYVANTFDDSISIVDIQGEDVAATISLGPMPELSLADRGELLFFDARLSHDSWMSCHSCHTDGHTNGLLNDNFSDASFGAPKRVLSLLGRADTAPFAWNASAATFEDQIRKSIRNTMQSDDPPTDQQLTALAAFVETLPSPPSIDEARGIQNPQAVSRGLELFESLNCTHCHKPPVFTTPKTYDVGLDDKLGKRRFNPPTLRGVGQRGPYFHDNRAASLEDVFLQHRHRLERDLSQDELSDLLSFLRSL